MFDSYLERMHLHRTQRIMDMSQATFYAQLTNQSRQKMYNGWNMLVATINTRMLQQDAGKSNPLFWNGQAISIRGLIRQFATAFGKDAVKA